MHGMGGGAGVLSRSSMGTLVYPQYLLGKAKQQRGKPEKLIKNASSPFVNSRVDCSFRCANFVGVVPAVAPAVGLGTRDAAGNGSGICGWSALAFRTYGGLCIRASLRQTVYAPDRNACCACGRSKYRHPSLILMLQFRKVVHIPPEKLRQVQASKDLESETMYLTVLNKSRS